MAANMATVTEIMQSRFYDTVVMDSKDVLQKESLVEEQEPLPSEIEDFDTVIVGAGISGINMAYRVQSNFPNRSYVVLEGREHMGGTWDIMRYPGIRSDSDLQTFGFAWRPWDKGHPIAEASLIVNYMKECTAAYDMDKNIRYRHKVKKAYWLSREQAWTLVVEATDEKGEKKTKYFRGKFMVLGTGYYDYDKPKEAHIEGMENFKGQVVHPQFWPEDIDYTDKKIAVVGSGATAITLIPALAKKAEKVTMVQRSPSYVVSIPNRARPQAWWEKILPKWMQHRISRLRFLINGFIYRRFLSRDTGNLREFLARITTAQLPKHIPYDPHFNPKYAPWTQRMCLCPDGDFFKALHAGKADVATGSIKTMTETGIVLESGQTIDADIIITATGLRMMYGGNAEIFVDGERIKWGEKFLWRGVMIQDMPNCSLVQGYTKASWTLGADATATMVCRMIKYLQRNKMSSATPRVPVQKMADSLRVTGGTSVMGLTSNYILQALHRVPKTSNWGPWQPRGNYVEDMYNARYASIKEGIQFVMSTE